MHFGVRMCSPRLPDANTYMHCLNDVIRFCTAPCVDRISSENYRRRFEDACAFLRGERPEIMRDVRAAMEAAAAERQFEKAASLRDTLFHLQRTIQQRARMAPTPEMRREEARQGIEALRDILGLDALPRVIEGFDISNISGVFAVASMVCSVNGVPHRNRYRRFRIRSVTGSDDPAMMAEVIRRRYARLQEEGGEMPGLVMVDGGITQLKAARHELSELRLGHLPVAGLAKRFEEIYWNEDGAPIRLPKQSAALKVLQRLRDEAHRFAITYHRHLRGTRIRESALDDIPGIGPRRKQQILQHFGSVHRLRRATPEAIAEVPGIGTDMAQIIWHTLHLES